ncbi:hypothetical protein K469DRAFT_620423 [Zopfia rhizophila CBS 207.26]|uniref:SET domain-containing protein n=1 Tax=Zopfia rhizophila CBS 207.26 TaxID=1314779 RepID=A0A6A6EJK9_9PEZI|nr:hypothetical protein K469DRAFT_620423 [Zopfia rhizophila CBS 207.26]
MANRPGDSRENAIALDDGPLIIDLTEDIEDNDDEDVENVPAAIDSVPHSPTPRALPSRPNGPVTSPARRTDIAALLNPESPESAKNSSSFRRLFEDQDKQEVQGPSDAVNRTMDRINEVNRVNDTTKDGSPPATTTLAFRNSSHSASQPDNPPFCPNPNSIEKRNSPISSRSQSGLDSFGEGSQTTPESRPGTSGKKTMTNLQPTSSRIPAENGSGGGKVSDDSSKSAASTSDSMKSPRKNMGSAVSSIQSPHMPLKSNRIAKKTAPSSAPSGPRLLARQHSSPLKPFPKPGSHARPEPVKEHPKELPESLQTEQQSRQKSPSRTSSSRYNPSQDGKVKTAQEKEVTESAPSPEPKNQPLVININDVEASIAVVEDTLKRHLTDLHENHAYIVKHKLARHRRCYDREVRSRKRAGTFSERAVPTIPDQFLQSTTPFIDMKPIQHPTLPKGAEKEKVIKMTQEVVHSGRSQNGVKSYISMPITPYKSTAVDVPFYHDYVGLRDNVLAENNRKLLYWPYFQEEELADLGKKGLWNELDEQFDMVNDKRPRHVLQAEQCRVHSPYVEKFLKDIDVPWENVLFWLLAQDEDINHINQTSNDLSSAEFEPLLLDRTPHCEEDFDRDRRRWKIVFSKLPKPSFRNLRLSALACSIFLRLCDFSMWHLARQSKAAQLQMPKDVRGSREVDNRNLEFTFRKSACRVCHEHDCPFHGEIREDPESDNDMVRSEKSSTTSSYHSNYQSDLGSNYDGSDKSEGSGESAPSKSRERRTAGARSEPEETGYDFSDSDIERVINYKRAVNATPHEHDELDPLDCDGIPPPKYSVHWWHQKSVTHLLHKRRPFYPCSHEGSCEQAQCRCFRDKIACEKTCACHVSCKRRFRGCSCAKDPRTRVCGGGKGTKCECRLLNRECDADLCGPCGAAEVLDPVNRYDEEVGKNKCCNVHIQRNLPKKTFLGQSEVHGFGLYVGEKVRADEYLGEYKGEVVTSSEGTRRGTIYTHLKTNYLFKLNKMQEVDSTRAGNKFRFINNSNEDHTINCYPQVMLCNTVVRIGMFAKRDLKPGVELFFNYGYPKDVTKDFWEKGEKPGARRKPVASTGKLVTVKTKKEDNYSSSSTKAKPLVSGTLEHSERSQAAKRAQTEKARAAKAKKHEMKKVLEQKNDSSSPHPTLSRITKLAKTSSFIESDTRRGAYRREALNTPAGLNIEQQFKHIAGNAGTYEDSSGGAEIAVSSFTGEQQSTESREIPESADEIRESDEDYLVNEKGDSEEQYEYESNLSESEPEASSDDGDGSRLRNSLGGIMEKRKDKVRAARKAKVQEETIRGQRGGRREGASRKRKRPLIEDDDDD